MHLVCSIRAVTEVQNSGTACRDVGVIKSVCPYVSTSVCHYVSTLFQHQRVVNYSSHKYLNKKKNMVSYKLLFLFQTSRLQILLEIYLREIEVNWKLEG